MEPRPAAPRVSAEVLATASSEVRVFSIALEALVSVAAAPSVATTSQSALIVMMLGA